MERRNRLKGLLRAALARAVFRDKQQRFNGQHDSRKNADKIEIRAAADCGPAVGQRRMKGVLDR